MHGSGSNGDGAPVRSLGAWKDNGKDKEADRREVDISKALTLILRHKALDFGLHIEPDGYVRAEDVLRCEVVARHHATMVDLWKITLKSNKQRFEVKQGPEGEGGHIYVRAVQGHSMNVVQNEKLGRRLRADDCDLPSECVHGTYSRCLNSSLESGLMPGGKQGPAWWNTVHFQPHAPGDRRVITEDSLGAPLQTFFDKYAVNAVSAQAQAIVAPWVLRSDADERCEMFPPGWDREPSWMARKSLRD
jgi:2'-phosphotransferase